LENELASVPMAKGGEQYHQAKSTGSDSEPVPTLAERGGAKKRSARAQKLAAEHRLGEMVANQRETVGLAQGKRTDLGPGGTQVDEPTLADAGVDGRRPFDD
jgi:hypothetical protein